MMELVKALSNRQYINGEWVESANKILEILLIHIIKK